MSTQASLDKLTSNNPFLSPDSLSSLYPSYKQFSSLNNHPHFWLTDPARTILNTQSNQHSQVSVLLSGIAASGKNAIQDRLIKDYPQLITMPVTATTRPPRPREVDGQDYHFYPTVKKFLQDVNKQKFIEHINQGTNKEPRLYGLPKKSIKKALKSNHPIILSLVEIESGWPNLEKYINRLSHPPLVLKVFVLPQLKFNYYQNNWLPKQRSGVASRIDKTIREIQLAGQHSHIIFTNPMQGISQLNRQVDFLFSQIRSLLVS